MRRRERRVRRRERERKAGPERRRVSWRRRRRGSGRGWYSGGSVSSGFVGVVVVRVVLDGRVGGVVLTLSLRGEGEEADAEGDDNGLEAAAPAAGEDDHGQLQPIDID